MQERGQILRGWSLNAGCEAKRADENNILLNQLLSFLSIPLQDPPPLSVIQHVLFLPASPALGTLALAKRHLSQMAADPRGAPHRELHTAPLCRAERLLIPSPRPPRSGPKWMTRSSQRGSRVGQENWLTLLSLPSTTRSEKH